MKKAMTTMLALMMLLTLTASASAAEADAHTYLSIATWEPDLLETFEVEGDANRILYVDILEEQYTLVRLPEDAPDAESFAETGVLLVFDAPLTPYNAAENGMQVLTASSVTIVGALHYGRITEIGDDYVIHDVYNTVPDPELSGNPTRYTLTPDTILLFEDPFEAGSGCQLIVDEDGTVLAMVEGNS